MNEWQIIKWIAEQNSAWSGMGKIAKENRYSIETKQAVAQKVGFVSSFV